MTASVNVLILNTADVPHRVQRIHLVRSLWSKRLLLFFRYCLEKEDAADYVLCDAIGQTGGDNQWKRECFRVVGDHEKPLLLQSLWKPKEGFSRRFEIQLRASVEEQSLKDRDVVTAGTDPPPPTAGNSHTACVVVWLSHAHCPAYQQLEQGRWQPCESGGNKAAVMSRGGQRGPALICVLLQGPMRAPGGPPCWAWSCSVILPIRADFLRPVDFGTCSLCSSPPFICIIVGNLSGKLGLNSVCLFHSALKLRPTGRLFTSLSKQGDGIYRPNTFF